MPSGVYKKSPEHLAKLAQYLELGRTPKARAKARTTLREIAADPTWKEKVSRATKEAMHQPDIRERHLAGLPKKGETNFKHGNGQDPSAAVQFAETLLIPLGFIREYPIRTKGHKTQHNAATNYKADFANPKTMTVIELDGPIHNSTKARELDHKKDEILQSLGWKIIRVRHD